MSSVDGGLLILVLAWQPQGDNEVGMTDPLTGHSRLSQPSRAEAQRSRLAISSRKSRGGALTSPRRIVPVTLRHGQGQCNARRGSQCLRHLKIAAKMLSAITTPGDRMTSRARASEKSTKWNRGRETLGGKAQRLDQCNRGSVKGRISSQRSRNRQEQTSDSRSR